MNKRIDYGKWLFRLVLVGCVGWLLLVIGLLWIIHHTGTVDERQQSDVIVVLGAGLSHSGRPGYALTRRASHAAELYHAGYADTIICTGGIAPNQTRSEADACAQVLGWRDVPRNAILLEEQSRSTEENAIYSYPIIQANGFDDVLLVSDAFHVFRARYIFQSEGITVNLSPVPRENMQRQSRSYTHYILREVAALHWQFLKEMLNLPVTHVP